MRRSLYFLTFAACASAYPANASSATWVATPGDALWSNGSNWGGTAPGNTSAGVTATSDIATFNTSLSGGIGGASTPVVVDSGRTTGGITFTGAAGDYVVGSAAGNPLSVSTGSIQSGGQISPGNSPGVLSARSAIFDSGGGYLFQMNTDGSTGTAGVNWDKLALTGNLNIAALTFSGTFTLTLQSLTGSNVAGLLASFDSSVNHTWTSIITTTGLTLPGGGFNPNLFSIDTSGFQNALSGNFTVVRDSGNPSNLNLVYTAVVPEPGTYSLLLGGLASLVVCQRRKLKS